MRTIVAASALLAATPALAADDGWHGSATIYLWAAGLDSQVEFPGPVGTRDISLSSGDVISNLRFALMGAGAVRKGRVGAFVDLVYANIGDSVTASRDFELGNLPPSANITGDFELDARTTLLTIGGSYALVDSPRFTLDVTAGTRLFDMRQTLDFRLTGAVGSLPPQEVAGSRSVNVSNWDFVGGLAGTYRFGKDARWFIPVRLDVGTGESDLTWQVLGGIGHSFGFGDVTFAYRRIVYELGGSIQDFSMEGPALGATFRF
jgi:hypothetical protein